MYPEQPGYNDETSQEQRIMTMIDLQTLYDEHIGSSMAVGYSSRGEAIGILSGTVPPDAGDPAGEQWSITVSKDDPLSREGGYQVAVVYPGIFNECSVSATNRYDTRDVALQGPNPWGERRLRDLLRAAKFFDQTVAETYFGPAQNSPAIYPSQLLHEIVEGETVYNRTMAEVDDVIGARRAAYYEDQRTPKGSMVTNGLRRAMQFIRIRKTR